MIIKDLVMILMVVLWFTVGMAMAFMGIDAHLVNLVFVTVMILLVLAMLLSDRFNKWLNRRL